MHDPGPFLGDTLCRPQQEQESEKYQLHSAPAPSILETWPHLGKKHRERVRYCARKACKSCANPSWCRLSCTACLPMKRNACGIHGSKSSRKESSMGIRRYWDLGRNVGWGEQRLTLSTYEIPRADRLSYNRRENRYSIVRTIKLG